MNDIEQYQLMQNMAQVIAKSGLFGMPKVEQVMALMIIAQAEGRPPGLVAMEYNLIVTNQGVKPSLKADAILARFMDAGGKIKWIEMSRRVCKVQLSHPSSGVCLFCWTIEDAEKAGLLKKENWVKYPRAMLRSRVISEGVRAMYPKIICGLYTPEEIESINYDGKPNKSLDITDHANVCEAKPPQKLFEPQNALPDDKKTKAESTKALGDKGLDRVAEPTNNYIYKKISEICNNCNSLKDWTNAKIKCRKQKLLNKYGLWVIENLYNVWKQKVDKIKTKTTTSNKELITSKNIKNPKQSATFELESSQLNYTNKTKCELCNGSGLLYVDGDGKECPSCAGSGQVLNEKTQETDKSSNESAENINKNEITSEATMQICLKCEGEGSFETENGIIDCDNCEGVGFVPTVLPNLNKQGK